MRTLRSLVLFTLLAFPLVADEALERSEVGSVRSGIGGSRVSLASPTSGLSMGLEDYELNEYNQTFRMIGLGVRNDRGTTTGTLRVELWASATIPVLGGNNSYYLVATYPIWALTPGNYFYTSDTGALPVTAPPPGKYWWTGVLTESSGGAYRPEMMWTDPNQYYWGGPLSGGNLAMSGTLAYSVDWSTGRAQAQIGRITNYRTAGTGAIQLQIRLNATPPLWGQSIGGSRLLRVDLVPLGGGTYRTNIDTGSQPIPDPISPGTYWATLMLLEQSSTTGQYYYESIYTFSRALTVPAGSNAPRADFGFSPANPTAGQLVTFSDLSTGSPTSWNWAFGDGATSALRNPTHAYAAAGAYPVTLSVSNANGSTSATRTVVVSLIAPPQITSFTATPSSVLPGQSATLAWTSSGGTSASIDHGIGSVATSGSVTLVPIIGVPYTLTVTGPGGSATASIVISQASPSYAATWLLPSSAHTPGGNGLWTTDLTVTNHSAVAATLSLKFLGHGESGLGGAEAIRTLNAGSTVTYRDVLSDVFGLSSDYGPILIRSTTNYLAVQGQTWTSVPGGGTFGQSMPALSPSELVGMNRKVITGVRQDGDHRTNLVLANATENDLVVGVTLLDADGAQRAAVSVELGPLAMRQFNVAVDLGVPSILDGAFLVTTFQGDAFVAAYASVIDSRTGDPRTLLAR